MATIIHDPTRGWLLLTPDGQIEIAKEDWLDLEGRFPDVVGFKLHHPYSVDAEFEVIEEGITTKVTDSSANTIIRKIARLVKAKEEQKNKLIEMMKRDEETGMYEESQDKLWNEAMRLVLKNLGDDKELKARFRIERITP